MDQKTALDILKTGQNVFLTGAAGTGKTYVLNQYVHYLRVRDVPVAITASTGIAATHLGGQTIHSWSGLGIREVLTDEDYLKILKNKRVREQVRTAKVLVIDEISMLSGKTLTLLDELFKYLRESFDPLADTSDRLRRFFSAATGDAWCD